MMKAWAYAAFWKRGGGGGRNFIKGDLSSRKMMDYVIITKCTYVYARVCSKYKWSIKCDGDLVLVVGGGGGGGGVVRTHRPPLAYAHGKVSLRFSPTHQGSLYFDQMVYLFIISTMGQPPLQLGAKYRRGGGHQT